MATANDTVVQLTTENFLNPFGIMKPQVRRQLLAYQDSDYFLSEILEELSMEEPVAGSTWSTFVEPKKIEPLVVATAFSAGATDAAVNVVLTASSISSTTSFARARMRLRRANGDIVFIQAMTPSTQTAQLLPQPGAAIAAGAIGEKLILLSNANPEGSNALSGYTGKARKIDNQLQIMKGTARATGSVTADELWFDLAQYGGTGQGWFDYEIISEVARFNYQMNMALLLEEQGTTTITAQYGDFAALTFSTTNGVIPQIKRDGKVINYSAGEPSLQWFYKIMNTLTAQYGDKENMFFAGQELRQNNTQWIIDNFKNGAITYGAFGGKKEISLALGFDSIFIDGFSFHQKNFDLYNMPDGLGAHGFTKNGFMLPTSQVKLVTDKDGNTKGMARPVRIRYKPMAGGQKMRIVPLDGLRQWGHPTSSDDVFTYQMIAEWGCELLAAWKGVVIEYAA